MKLNFWQIIGVVVIIAAAIGIFIKESGKSTKPETDTTTVQPAPTVPEVTTQPASKPATQP